MVDNLEGSDILKLTGQSVRNDLENKTIYYGLSKPIEKDCEEILIRYATENNLIFDKVNFRFQTIPNPSIFNRIYTYISKFFIKENK